MGLLRNKKFVSTALRQMLFLAGLAAVAPSIVSAYVPKQLRAVTCINKGWTFIKQDVAVSQATATADPSGWSNINIPHSFDIPYWRASVPVPPQLGWYRKHVTIDQAVIDAKKRVFMEFEAAFQIANVYVNGSFVGQHKGGYTGFSFDITQYVKPGDNVVAVHLDARWCDTIVPLGGEHIFIGGIYRNAYLVITDPLHVTWYGTFVTTPQATSSTGTVKVKTEIKNDGTADASCTVKSIVVDASGNQVTSFESTQNVSAGATVTFVQMSDPISNPHLWSTDSPYMYTVYTEVNNATSAVDNFQSPLGFRTIKWTTTDGFELNGKRVWLQGANVHQDHAGWGDATASTGSYRDVKIIKDCGMNFIRGSHYPHAPAFSDACDRLGVCLWSEGPLWGTMGGSRDWQTGVYANNDQFKKCCVDVLKEMIRIHRNHPSVIAWSMGNELFFTSNMDSTAALLGRLTTIARSEDSTRPAGVGGAQTNPTMWAKYCDILGINGDPPVSQTTISIPHVHSEYGSCANGGESYDGCWDNNPSFTKYGQSTNGIPTQFTWRCGISLWCAFDHGSNCDMGWMGMVDHARIPQMRWYYYRETYLGTKPPAWAITGTPAKLKLTADRDTITDDGRSDAQLLVQVQDASGTWVSSSPDITLTDKSGLGSFPTGASITFHGTGEGGVRGGQSAIEFRSYNAGVATIEAASGSLPKTLVTIVVVSAPAVGVSPRATSGAFQNKDCRVTAIVKVFGRRITMPSGLSGKDATVSLFDTRGRLVEQRTVRPGCAAIRAGAAEGVVIAKIQADR